MINRDTSRHKKQTYEKIYVDSFYLQTMTGPHWGYVCNYYERRKSGLFVIKTITLVEAET